MDLGFAPLDVAATPDELPMFAVQHVPLQFALDAHFTAAEVANNVLVLALSTGRLLRIDYVNSPEKIDDIDLPASRRNTDPVVVSRLFLDPTASHLLIGTEAGDTYYLHSQARQPRLLSRLRGLVIESVAWNPGLPSSSTCEILLGTSSGKVYEITIETNARDVKHLKELCQVSDDPVTGLWAEKLSDSAPVTYRVLVGTKTQLLHFTGQSARNRTGSTYQSIFESEHAIIKSLPQAQMKHDNVSALAVSLEDNHAQSNIQKPSKRPYIWLTSSGTFLGQLIKGSSNFEDVEMLDALHTHTETESSRSASVRAAVLSQWHIISLVDGFIVITNRLSGHMVSRHEVLGASDPILKLAVDHQGNTFWLFTRNEIFEIVVRNEGKNIWLDLMGRREFDEALRHCSTRTQQETVWAALGDDLLRRGLWHNAADAYGRSNKCFESIALHFIDHDQPDALRKYLLAKLSSTKKSSYMQRTMLTSWLLEIFMGRLASLEHSIATSKGSHQARVDIQQEYRDFVDKYAQEFDQNTAYSLVSAYGYQEELLYFASARGDYEFKFSYFEQREDWDEILKMLTKKVDPKFYYHFSSVMMTHAPGPFVEVLMRRPDLKPRRLMPAMLDYARSVRSSSENQALRYIEFLVYQLQAQDHVVHNTLIALCASDKVQDEPRLLSYLQTQNDKPRYDADLALRICKQYGRTRCCVYILTSMGDYLQAVDLALSCDEIALAMAIADEPSTSELRKKLWRSIARRVITQSGKPSPSKDLLKRCDALSIEDLIPMYPDFVVIDDLKEEVCEAVENYVGKVDQLRRDMDSFSRASAITRQQIASLKHRYIVVEPGERCHLCEMPLLARSFFVFPCQHSFHSDCLHERVLGRSGLAKRSLIRQSRKQHHHGHDGVELTEDPTGLDSLLASSCVLCGDVAIDGIDEPFMELNSRKEEWAL
ncbi:pep3/Vps18/deep orange family protein [Sarocladium implicatum]|nr:pep3/Vps18/deep orange family protein [Sarocladium implicatum]